MKQERSIKPRGEEGQSIILVVFIIFVLIALVALVVDIGNAYAQRRILQNTADASALAATGELADAATTNRAVLQKAREYVKANLNVTEDDLNSGKVSFDARYFSFDPDTKTQTDLGAVPDNTLRPADGIDGVTVDVGRPFGTYLAQVVGRKFLAASALSSGQVSCGVCIAGGPGQTGLFPIAVNVELFSGYPDNGEVDLGKTYRIWDKDNDPMPPGNFGYLSWNQDPGHTSDQTLEANMHDTGRSGLWHVGDNVPVGPGVKASNGVRDELDARIAGTDPVRPRTVLLPIYDTFSGTGSNATYHIVGFGAFRLDRYDFQGEDKYIEGYFTKWSIPSGDTGCPDYGVCVAKLRPPMDLTRSIEGRINYQYLETKTNCTPDMDMDVVHVLDISSSMNRNWAAGETQIQTARTVLKSFNTQLKAARPAKNDRLGLVVFPGANNTGASYSRKCPNNQTTSGLRQFSTNNLYQFAAKRSGLTTDVNAVNTLITNQTNPNGNTPSAGGLKVGRETLLPNGKDESRCKFLLFVSDGLANTQLDGKWPWYRDEVFWKDWGIWGPPGPPGASGVGTPCPTCNPEKCNAQPINEATDQAELAKENGAIIFSVGVGGWQNAQGEWTYNPSTGQGFDPTMLQVAASSPQDMFIAKDKAGLQNIFTTLAQRIAEASECTAIPHNLVGSGATVRLLKDGTELMSTQADASGSFAFNNISPGTYTLAASVVRNGITYDVFTSGVGGMEIPAPSVTVGEPAGIYSVDASLKTDTPPSCQQ